MLLQLLLSPRPTETYWRDVHELCEYTCKHIIPTYIVHQCSFVYIHRHYVPPNLFCLIHIFLIHTPAARLFAFSPMAHDSKPHTNIQHTPCCVYGRCERRAVGCQFIHEHETEPYVNTAKTSPSLSTVESLRLIHCHDRETSPYAACIWSIRLPAPTHWGIPIGRAS